MAQGAQGGRMCAACPQRPARTRHEYHAPENEIGNEIGVLEMSKKQEIAIGIALQTQVLKACPLHNQLYFDDDEFAEDENMARAFAVAIELVRQHPPYAQEFHHNAHELTDLLSYTISAAPTSCPECASPRYAADDEGRHSRALAAV
jgi:hypothetical protein